MVIRIAAANRGKSAILGNLLRYQWFIMVAVLAVWYSWTAAFNHDEIEHLHASWLVAEGFTPYRDFFEHHNPLYWYVLWPIVRCATSPHVAVFSARLFDLLLCSVLLCVFFRFAKVFSERAAPWAALLMLASFMFFNNSMEVRPDTLMNLLVFAGLYFWSKFLVRLGKTNALLSGVMLGLAAVVLQKALVFIAIIGLSGLIVALLNLGDRQRLKGIVIGFLWAALSAAVPIVVFCAWLWRGGLWDDYFFWNFTFNRFLFVESGAQPDGTTLRIIWHAFLQNPVLLMFGVAGIILSVKDIGKVAIEKWRLDVKITLAFVFLSYVAATFFNRFAHAQYFLICFPILALFSLEVFARAGRRISILLRALVILVVMELAVILSFRPMSVGQQEVQDYVLKNSSPSEVVAVPPPYHPIYRRDGVFFWFNGQRMGEVFAAYCGVHYCGNMKSQVDGKSWQVGAFPVFVYLPQELKFTRPYGWEVHSVRYVETEFKNLFRLRPR